MARIIYHRGLYDDTGEEVTVVRTIPQIEIRSSTDRCFKDGLANVTLVDGSQLTPIGADQYRNLENNRTITLVGD